MNRNLDGTPLTRGQLLDLALASGMSPEKNTRDVKTFVFAEACARLRFEMFCRGELTLDTSEAFVPKPLPTVDPEMVAFFAGARTGA